MITSTRLLQLSLFLCTAAPVACHAQVNQPPPTYDRGNSDPFKPGRPTDAANHDDDESMKFLQHRMAESRKLDRKRRMVDTANRLLALTKQLQDDLQGREATPEDGKRLDEIARLARQVKDQMRQ